MHPSQIARAQAASRFTPTLKHARFNVMGITPAVLTRWSPILAVWGVAAGAGVIVFTSDIPKFKRDILDKIPLVREYYKDKTPDSDKPF